MKHPIDEYFREHLADVEVKPRKNLFAEKIAPNIPQRKGVYPAAWLRVAAVLLLLLSARVVVWFFNTSSTTHITPLPKQTIVVAPQTPAQQPQQIVANNTPADSTPAKVPGQKAPLRLAGTGTLPNDSLEAPKMAVIETHVEERTEADERPAYRVKLKIDPSRYATAAPEESATETGGLLAYASEQVKHIKDGDKLQAPPAEWFELPKVALRVEGNPLRRILPGLNKESENQQTDR